MRPHTVAVKEPSNWPPLPTGPGRQSLPRPRGDGGSSLRAIIAASLFLGLFAGCFLVGGHAAIAPMLRSAAAARDATVVGDVVLPMPGGKFCRHMSFDNTTAEIAEGPIEQCPEKIARFRTPNSRSFAWGAPTPPPQ